MYIMKKVIRLTEKDLGLLIKRVLKEESNDISNSTVCLSIKDAEILFGVFTEYCVNSKWDKYLGTFCSNLERIGGQIENVYSQNDLKRDKFEAMKYL